MMRLQLTIIFFFLTTVCIRVYGQLLTAQTSDSAMHCFLVSTVQQRLSSLLTTAMSGHQTTDPDVAFGSSAFSATVSRITPAANSSVSQLALSIPASAFAGANT